MNNLSGFGRDDVIAALRDVQTSLHQAEQYSADGKFLLSSICEDYIKALHESNKRFWSVYRLESSDNPDFSDEVMEKVFAILNIETIDSIAQVLS